MNLKQRLLTTSANTTCATFMACAISVLAVVATTNSDATVITTVRVGSVLTGNLDPQSCSQDSAVGLAGCSLQDQTKGTGSKAGADAFASPGVLNVSVAVDLTSQFNINNNANLKASGRANAFASFTDAMTINAAGMAGQSGRLIGGFVVSGSANADVSGILSANDSSGSVTYAGLFTLGSAQAGFQGNVREDLVAGNVATPAPNLVYVMDTPFVFGRPLAMVANFDISSDAVATRSYANPNLFVDSTASATGDFGHTIYWGGITSIMDALANSIAFTVTSESGVNYALATVAPLTVPEPAGGAL